jgi:urease gamma subunit
MTDKVLENPADMFYAEGKKYDWRQDQSPAAATLARAAFQRAAAMNHTGAIRALAHMIFDGRGGGQDREHALLLLWSAFLLRDNDALEELEDMLESYAETSEAPSTERAASEAAHHVEELGKQLSRVGTFMHALAHERSSRNDVKVGSPGPNAL